MTKSAFISSDSLGGKNLINFLLKIGHFLQQFNIEYFIPACDLKNVHEFQEETKEFINNVDMVNRVKNLFIGNSIKISNFIIFVITNELKISERLVELEYAFKCDTPIILLIKDGLSLKNLSVNSYVKRINFSNTEELPRELEKYVKSIEPELPYLIKTRLKSRGVA